jgi:fatty-acyl-CoA synthase
LSERSLLPASLTFGEVDAAANRIAHVLAGLGVARGDRVGLLIGNGVWSIPVDFGGLKAGAARVPLNVRLAADEQAGAGGWSTRK